MERANNEGGSSEVAQGSILTRCREQEFKQHLKKRKFYRQSTDTMEVWFPQDNAKELLKEFVWTAGGDKVKWVCHGTPAAGNGVVGILEMGCNAMALCQDEHHKNFHYSGGGESC